MAHFILVHGFNDRSAGSENLDKVAPLLREKGHTVDTDSADYGWLGLIWVRFRKRPAVLRIIEAIKAALAEHNDVVVVGYSNGANYSVKALRLLFIGHVKLILVHPALKRTTVFPASASRIWVCFTRSDWATRMASYVRWLIPGWGRMGTSGYKGNDPRVTNIDYSDVSKGHGGLFKEPALNFFAGELDRLVRTP